MTKLLTAAAFAALAMLALSGEARAECYWAGNHWNCPDRYIYPKTYPWGTSIIEGHYQRPMSPPQSDVTYPATSAPQPR